MTVPQITTVTPAEGLASGRALVTVRGIHFRVPEVGGPLNTVMVTFNGVEAEVVVVVARYRLDVVTPWFLGDATDLPSEVDVVVTNLDDDGDPISGETVTKVDGYKYKRPGLGRSAASPKDPVNTLDAVNMEFLDVLQRNLMLEVAPSTDPDWSDVPASGLTAVAQLPAILVDGPNASESHIYRRNGPQESDRNDVEESVAVTAPPFTASVAWGIVIIAEHKITAVNAKEAAIRFFNRRPYLRVPTSAARTEFREVEISVGDWSSGDRPTDDIYTYETTITVQPIDLDDDSGLASGGIPSADEPTVLSTEDSDDFLELETDDDV